MCKFKKDGGLGLRSTRKDNSSFMLKVVWNFCSNPDSFWGSLTMSKYSCGRYMIRKIDPNKQGSNFRKGLGHVWKDFCNNLVWKLGNREDIKFWLDRWIPNTELLFYSLFNINETYMLLRVSHFLFLMENGNCPNYLLTCFLRA